MNKKLLWLLWLKLKCFKNCLWLSLLNPYGQKVIVTFVAQAQCAKIFVAFVAPAPMD